MSESDPWGIYQGHQQQPAYNHPQIGNYNDGYQRHQPYPPQHQYMHNNPTSRTYDYSGRNMGTVRQLNYQGTYQTGRRPIPGGNYPLGNVSAGSPPMLGVSGGSGDPYYDNNYGRIVQYPSYQSLNAPQSAGISAPPALNQDLSDFERNSGRSRGYLQSSRMDMLYNNLPAQIAPGSINEEQHSSQSGGAMGWFNRARRSRDITVPIRSGASRQGAYWAPHNNSYSNQDIQRSRDVSDEDSQLANAIVFQKRLMEKYNFQLIAQSKQTVLSYLFTIFCISIFLMLHMFRKKGYDFIIIEFVFIPLGIDCLQTIALSNIHLRLPLYRHLPNRTRDCKIAIIDQMMILLFFILNSLACRLQDIDSPMPYTAACAPLIVLLAQRFIWYQSFIKAFKNPQHIIKYLIQLLLVNLAFNFSLRADELINFDVIAILWPCYGLIALSFIFFAASFLLFISSACNQFTGQEEETECNNETGEEGSLFTCTTSTGLLINSGYFLGFSIIGFMALLKQVKEESVFEQGYIGLTICGGICAIFIVCQLKLITGWYFYKLLRPQIATELIIALKTYRSQEMDFSELDLQSVSSEQHSRHHQTDDNQNLNSSNPNNNSQVQLRRAEIEAITKQNIFKRDLLEINKIELLEEAEPDEKGRILGQVPLFLVKVSKSYFQRVEHYTKSFMNRVNQYQIQPQKDRIPQPGNLMNLSEMKGSKFAYVGARAKKKLAAKNKDNKKAKVKIVPIKAKDMKGGSNKKIRSQDGIMSLIQKINDSQEILKLKDIELGVGPCGDTDIDKLSIPEENNSDRGLKILDPMTQPVQPAPQASVPPSSDNLLTNKKEEDMTGMIFDPPQKEVYFGQSHSMSEQQRKGMLFSSMKKPANPSALKKSTISLNFDHENDKTGDNSSELLRMCLTSQLQSVQISNSVESSSDQTLTHTNTEGTHTERSRKEKKKRKKTHESMYPDKSAVQEERNKKRRKSFDLTLLKEFKDKHSKTPPKKQIKQNIAKLLVEINHEMGMNATEEDSEDNESLDTIKRLQNAIKQPFVPPKAVSKRGSRATSKMTEEAETAGIRNLCMLCLERKSDAVIMDCGHSKICFFCAFKMYRTQALCHLCRQDITKVIKIKRSVGLSYQKVIGILQMFEGKFYYSDVNRDLVKELKLYHKLNNPQLYEEKPKQNQEGGVVVLGDDDIPVDLDKSNLIADPKDPQSRNEQPVAPLAMILEEDVDGDLATDIIDECLSGNQIVELQNGNYAFVARSGKRIFNQDVRELKKKGTREIYQRRRFQEEIDLEANPNGVAAKDSRIRANSF